MRLAMPPLALPRVLFHATVQSDANHWAALLRSLRIQLVTPHVTMQGGRSGWLLKTPSEQCRA